MTVEAPIAPPPIKWGGYRHGRTKRRLPLWIVVILWIPVAAMAVVALMRIFAWDRFEPFAVLNSVTVFVYLPAWLVAIVALIGRRFVLGIAALLIVVAQLLFLAPELTATEPLPSWVAHAPTIRLLDANVYNENKSMAGYAREIKSVKPDLVAMEEANPVDAAQLLKSGALVGLPYTIEVKRYDPSAFFIASRYPVSGTKVVYDYGRPLIIQTTLHLPSGPQTLWVVHTTAPLPESFSQWKGQLALINQQVRARGSAGLLLMGDFNATWGNKGLRTILDTGLADGAAARGHPFDMTWSQIKRPLPPMVRIDHVLTGTGVAVSQIRTGDGVGSDHRDLVATVAFDR